MIDDLIQGDRVDLLRFSVSDDHEWSDEKFASFAKVPLPPPISFVNLDFSAGLQPYIGWNYHVGIGIDTTGAPLTMTAMPSSVCAIDGASFPRAMPPGLRMARV